MHKHRSIANHSVETKERRLGHGTELLCWVKSRLGPVLKKKKKRIQFKKLNWIAWKNDFGSHRRPRTYCSVFVLLGLEQSNDRVGVRYAWFHTLCMVPQGCRADRYDGQTSGPTHAALIFCTLHWPPGKTLYRRTELLRGGSDPKHVLRRVTPASCQKRPWIATPRQSLQSSSPAAGGKAAMGGVARRRRYPGSLWTPRVRWGAEP